MLSGTIAYQEYFLKNIFAINSYKLKKIKYNEDLTKQIYFITNRESSPNHDLIISKTNFREITNHFVYSGYCKKCK